MRLFLVTDRHTYRLVTGTLDAEGVPDPQWTGNLTPPMPSVEALRDMLTAGLQACGEPARDASEFTYPRVRAEAPALPDRPEGAG